MKTSKNGSSSSLGRAFDVLGLFSLATPVLRIEDITAKLGYTRSTAYRYTKELCDAGLLTAAYGGVYSLGSRIIELERLLELTDPLYRAASEVLPGIRRDNSVLLLQSLYKDKVLCIYKEGPDVLEHEGERIRVRRARGMPFPLFQGAASLALLAHLSPHRIQQTYLRLSADVKEAGLGENWDTFRRNLAAIRRKGFCVSIGQITPFLAGVAVPILLPDDRRVIGSLSRSVPSAVLNETLEGEFVSELADAAKAIALKYIKASTS